MVHDVNLRRARVPVDAEPEYRYRVVDAEYSVQPREDERRRAECFRRGPGGSFHRPPRESPLGARELEEDVVARRLRGPIGVELRGHAERLDGRFAQEKRRHLAKRRTPDRILGIYARGVAERRGRGPQRRPRVRVCARADQRRELIRLGPEFVVEEPRCARFLALERPEELGRVRVSAGQGCVDPHQSRVVEVERAGDRRRHRDVQGSTDSCLVAPRF